MSLSKPIVVVCGATGAQGSSVVHYLLQDGGYAVRALTRDISGEKAQDLKKQGAEVTYCDIANRELVTNAFHDAYAVFGLTNFWEHGEAAEINQGRILADTAKACGIKHFIWSSLPRDNIKPRHWESKIVIEEYLKEIGVPLTSIFPAFYFENLWMFFPPKRNPDGTFLLDWFFPSDVRIPSFAAEDFGAWFMVAIKDPKAWIGKDIRICVQKYTPRDYPILKLYDLMYRMTCGSISRRSLSSLRCWMMLSSIPLGSTPPLSVLNNLLRSTKRRFSEVPLQLEQ